MSGRCCGRCRTPYQICALKTCKCHGSDIDAEIIPLRDYLEGKS